jgi:hypothetical protein
VLANVELSPLKNFVRCRLRPNLVPSNAIKTKIFMKKIIVLFIAVAGFAVAHAQTSPQTANQNVRLHLVDAITISTAANVQMDFSTVSNYSAGVESAEQTLTVSSNKNYHISLHAAADNLSDGGSGTIPVTGVLKLNVTGLPAGGGTAVAPFASGYGQVPNLTTGDANLVTGAIKGESKSTTFKYKATPGFSYAGGDYDVAVIFTATQD